MSSGKPAPRSFPVRPPMPGRAYSAAPQMAWNDPSQRTLLLVLGGLVLLVVLAFWDTLTLTSRVWFDDDLYSHGWIVPLCAAGLLWLRWEPLGAVRPSERWMGVGLLVFGLVARLVAAYWGMNPVDRLAFLPAMFGVFMMVGGVNVIRSAWPAIGFLIFMFPLPTKLETSVLLRLQTLAAASSTFVLQTLGVAAIRDMRRINISGIELAVADACSGLRMVTIFCALAVAMVFLIDRPWWDKFIILLSAIPIALMVNIIRITAIGVGYLWVGEDNRFVHALVHDWAGLLMMVLALGIMWLELQILERLTIPVETGQLRPVGSARGVVVPAR